MSVEIYRSAGRGCDGRVERVHVEGEVDGAIPARVHGVEGHLDDPADAVAVDVGHAERLDAVLAEDLLLAGVDVAEADVHDPVRPERGLDPRELGDLLAEAEEEGDGHAVDVPGLGRLRGVDVGVGVDPDDARVGVGAAERDQSSQIATFLRHGRTRVYRRWCPWRASGRRRG
jgi:hypothetical protein